MPGGSRGRSLVWPRPKYRPRPSDTAPPTRHRRAQSRAAASGVPPRAAGGSDCEGQPGGVPGRIRTWTSRETGRIGQDAQGLWPPSWGNWSKEHRETPEVDVLTWGSAPHSALGRAQGPMPLVGSSLREKRATEKGTPVSSNLVSSGRAEEPRLRVPLNWETLIM